MQDWVELPLTRGMAAKIDRADMLIVGRWMWQATRNAAGIWYAKRSERRDGRGINISLHRWIMEPPVGMAIDHVNGDGLDNRRANLRICTYSQNNSHKAARIVAGKWYTGVTPARSRSGWAARLRVGGGRRTVQIGTFATAAQAAEAYDRTIVAARGEFATTNFPMPDEQRLAIDSAADAYDAARRSPTWRRNQK